MIRLTELITQQLITFGTMTAAGILIQILWQIRTYAKRYLSNIIVETSFWIAAAYILTSFLYYCAYGKVSLYGGAGFLTGLLLCRKICCGILKEVWEEKEEAENLKTTARSSTSKRRENKGWKKDRQRRKRKKKK